MKSSVPILQRQHTHISRTNMKTCQELLYESINIADNPNFWKWFGNSKIVDEQGNPLVVYHGSTRGGISQSGTRNSFFSSDYTVAKTYSEDDYESAKGENPIIQSMFLKIENPLIVDAQGNAWMDIEYNGHSITTNDLPAIGRRQGHDGVIVFNVEDNVADEQLPSSTIYITLGKKAQIKSATGNNGDFDPNDPDITH